MKRKILFLDFDGVLNPSDNLLSLATNETIKAIDSASDKYGHFFDDRCVRHLNWIYNETSCDFVISSTWRKDGLMKMQQMWIDRNMPGNVIDVTPLYPSQYIINMYGLTHDETDRGLEIQQWLEENKCDTYCILDDDDDMLNIQQDNFIKIDLNFGLDYFAAQKAIYILNK